MCPLHIRWLPAVDLWKNLVANDDPMLRYVFTTCASSSAGRQCKPPICSHRKCREIRRKQATKATLFFRIEVPPERRLNGEPFWKEVDGGASHPPSTSSYPPISNMFEAPPAICETQHPVKVYSNGGLRRLIELVVPNLPKVVLRLTIP